MVLAVLAGLAGCGRKDDARPAAQSTSAAPPVSATSPTPAAPASLEATVQARLDSLPAQSSFYARDIRTGREVAIRADQPMNTVSVIKLAVWSWPTATPTRDGSA